MINAEKVARDVVVIGASAGGIESLVALLERLPGGLNVAAAAVIHLNPFRQSRLAAVLGRSASMPVVAASDGMRFETGRLYVAVPDHHLRVAETLSVTRDAKEHFHRPAIDPLFHSAAASFGVRVVGVLLSGSTTDGVTGASAIKAAGGIVLVQAPESARHPRLPATAITRDGVDAALTIEQIAGVLRRLARGEIGTPVG